MLIIAIPKSASSSLLKTLGDLFQLPAKQDIFKDYQVPIGYKVLWKYHSDMREISNEQVIRWSSPDSIYKQHILPTENNISKLSGYKKVILLRKPVDVVLSYRRTQILGLSKGRVEFNGFSSEEDWIENSGKIGLMDDLYNFYYNWLNEADDNLIVQYEELVDKPIDVINKIAKYWNFQFKEKRISLAQERYTRGTKLSRLLYRGLKKYGLR